jgi:hypothetical protein
MTGQSATSVAFILSLFDTGLAAVQSPGRAGYPGLRCVRPFHGALPCGFAPVFSLCTAGGGGAGGDGK